MAKVKFSDERIPYDFLLGVLLSECIELNWILENFTMLRKMQTFLSNCFMNSRLWLPYRSDFSIMIWMIMNIKGRKSGLFDSVICNRRFISNNKDLLNWKRSHLSGEWDLSEGEAHRDDIELKWYEPLLLVNNISGVPVTVADDWRVDRLIPESRCSGRWDSWMESTVYVHDSNQHSQNEDGQILLSVDSLAFDTFTFPFSWVMPS